MSALHCFHCSGDCPPGRCERFPSQSTTHKHIYEIVHNVPPWWARLLGAPRTREHRCAICLKPIDEVIADLEAQMDIILATLRR